MIRELVHVGASRQHLRHRQGHPLGGGLPSPSSFPGRRLLVSPGSGGSQSCSCFHRAGTGQATSWRGGGQAGVGLVPGGGMRRSHCSRWWGCGSVGPWGLWLVDPPGPQARPRPGSCHPGAFSSRCRQGRPAPPGGQAQGVGSGLPGKVRWVCTTRAGGPPRPGAWGGSHPHPPPACVRGAARACTPLPKR